MAAGMQCVTVNIIWKYCTAGGQWYGSWNAVCYSEHYLEGTAQQVDSGMAAGMKCVKIIIE